MRAELVSPELIKAFFIVIGTMCVSNIGAIVGAAVQFFRAQARMRRDLDYAFLKIRNLESRVKNENQQQPIEGEKK